MQIGYKKVTLAVLASLALASCGLFQKPKPPAPLPAEVETITIEPQNIPLDFEFVGFTQSSHMVEIRARVEGYLEKIAYTEGQLVKEGQLLFLIDQRPFIAALEQAKGTREKQEAVLWDAKQNADRLKPLYEQKAASKRDYDNAISQLHAAEADLAAAKAAEMTAKINLDFTTIRSPIRGLSGLSQVREGALVTTGANGLLTTVSAVDPIWVIFSLSENDLLKYTQEQAQGHIITPKNENDYIVEIVLANGTTFNRIGRVNFSAPYLDQKTGTLTIRAEFPNPDATLKPGQFVRVKVKGAVRPNAIAVPQEAVMQGKDEMYVYLVDEKNQAVLQPVVPGDWYGNKWIIKSGLRAGDQVIMQGANKVREGMQVKVVKKEKKK